MAENKAMDDFEKELMQEQYAEYKELVESILDHKLPDVLEEVSQPLSLKEKRALKKYELRSVESLDDEKTDELIFELAKLRGVSDDVLDAQVYSELLIWVRKVVYSTFNLKVAAKK